MTVAVRVLRDSKEPRDLKEHLAVLVQWVNLELKELLELLEV